MYKISIGGERGVGLYAMVDDADYLKLSRMSWHLKEGGYPATNVKVGHNKYKQVSMHKMIMGTPQGFDTDHIDGNPLNNQRSNLRVCSHSQNVRNRTQKSKNSKTGYKGVTIRYGKKILSRITVNGKKIHLGYFKNVIDAAKAYNEAAIKYHGEFASLNNLTT